MVSNWLNKIAVFCKSFFAAPRPNPLKIKCKDHGDTESTEFF